MQMRAASKWCLAILVAGYLMAPAAAGAGIFTLTPKKVVIGGVVVGAGLFLASKVDCREVQDPETGVKSHKCFKLRPVNAPVEKSGDTRKLRKELNEERSQQGLPPDPENCDAHHIVPKAMRGWAAEFADPARAFLEGCVGIDSAANGVYLPGNKSKSAQCDGTYHKSVHSKSYFRDLESRLRIANRGGGCEAVKDELQLIKEDLVNGRIW